ncbi:hypothetical protein AYL99_11732 [Fonsecaea erecta]|uniref:Uncharacterized protein n=1 Tax=Fonsecaea erecta TaxID=1367422 RepID=A0A178Z389_9EURO|nr:hypothetical protein AYL99_11732 [Fonsecaea erecta]OAP54197.1 hypothetical protein AYL99_11732 [Fonsecaea erecta]
MKACVPVQVQAALDLLSTTVSPSDTALLFVVGEEKGGDGMRHFSSSQVYNHMRNNYKVILFGDPTKGKLSPGRTCIRIDSSMATSIDRTLLEGIAFDAATECLRYIDSVTAGNEGPEGVADVASRIVRTHITDRLRCLFPTDDVLDALITKGTSGRTWVMKPIDAANQFVQGYRHWAISFGLFDGTRPLFGVIYMPGQGKMVSGGVHWPPTLNGHPMQKLSIPTVKRISFAVSWDMKRSDPAFLQLAQHNARFRYREDPVLALITVMSGQFEGYINDSIAVKDLIGPLAILSALGVAYDIAPASGHGGKGVRVHIGWPNRGPVRGVGDDQNCLALLLNEPREWKIACRGGPGM